MVGIAQVFWKEKTENNLSGHANHCRKWDVLRFGRTYPKFNTSVVEFHKLLHRVKFLCHKNRLCQIPVWFSNIFPIFILRVVRFYIFSICKIWTNLHLQMVVKIKLYQNRICIWGWSTKSNFKPYQFASEDGWQNQTFISKPICIWVWSAKSNYIKTNLHLRMVGKIKFLYQNQFASEYGQQNQIISKSICIWGWSAKSNFFIDYWFAS